MTTPILNRNFSGNLNETVTNLDELARAVDELIIPTLNAIYPIGIVITLGVSTNPATLFGIGTWTAIAGKVIVGIDGAQTEFDTLNETGGAKTHTLVSGEMPVHTHVQNSHNHTQGSHNHTQNSDQHTIQGRQNSTPGTEERVVLANASAGSAKNMTTLGSTATNQAATATNEAATATNQNTGGGGTHNNLQPYIVKYVWERTA
jgi:microcystin-dependent protein